MVELKSFEKIEQGYSVQMVIEGKEETVDMPETEFEYFNYVYTLFQNQVISEEQSDKLMELAAMNGQFLYQLGQVTILEHAKRQAEQQMQQQSLNNQFESTESGIFIPKIDSGIVT